MNEELKTYYVYYDDEVIGQLLCENDEKADDYAEELFFDPEKMDPQLFSIDCEEDEEIEEGLELNEELSDHDWNLVKEEVKKEIGLEDKKDMEKLMLTYRTKDPFQAIATYKLEELGKDFKITNNKGDSKIKTPLLDFVEKLNGEDVISLGEMIFDYVNDHDKEYKNIPSMRDLLEYDTRDLIRNLPDDLINSFIRDFEWNEDQLAAISYMESIQKAEIVCDLANMFYNCQKSNNQNPFKFIGAKEDEKGSYYLFKCNFDNKLIKIKDYAFVRFALTDIADELLNKIR